MKTVTLDTRSKILKNLLKLAQESDVLLQMVDGSQFVLHSVRDADAFYVGNREELSEEIQIARENVQLMKFLDERGTQAKQRKGIPLSEVRNQLGL